MTNQHPIQPSPELVSQCMEMFKSGTRMEVMCEIAAQWGADQELEACEEWLERNYDEPPWDGHSLRNSRRPKPPTLKKQALAALGRFIVNAHTNADEMNQDFDTIRRALEALPND